MFNNSKSSKDNKPFSFFNFNNSEKQENQIYKFKFSKMETRPKFYNESEVSLEKSSFEISGAEIQQNYHNLHHNSFTLMKKYSEKVEILDKFPFSSFLM